MDTGLLLAIGATLGWLRLLVANREYARWLDRSPLRTPAAGTRQPTDHETESMPG